MSDAVESPDSPTTGSSAHPFAGTRAAHAPQPAWSPAIFGRLALGAVVLGVLLVAAGLVLTRLLYSWTHAEGLLERWLLAHRTRAWNDITLVASDLAKTATAVAVAAVAFFVLRVWLRRWHESLVLVIALAGEVLIFLTVAFIVHRPRPPVFRLDPAPPTSSFPSGHTAAAVVVYGFLAFVIWRYMANRYLAAMLCALLIAVPVAVGLSRLYRGAHFPSDVIAGAVLGVVWLSFVIRTLLPDHPREQRRTTPLKGSDSSPDVGLA